MSNTSTIPVILGLAAGIAFIFIMSYGTILLNAPILYATNDNPLGFDARIAFIHNYTHSCMQQGCPDAEIYVFKRIHTEPAWLLGYVVCNDAHVVSCIRVEGSEGASATPTKEERARPPIDWGWDGIGKNLNWKVGSAVHIWVKIAPNIVTIEGNSEQFHIDKENIRWVDLGESEIFEYNHREWRAAR